jgi:outer membrane protein assembly factor BamB/orotate phosphoribosyltransferase
MEVIDLETRRNRLKNALENGAFVRFGASDTHYPDKKSDQWIFDVRAIILTAQVLEDISALFWHQQTSGVVQIGGLESGAIPIVTALTYSAHITRTAEATGFYIRKSRKKSGLAKLVEGTVTSEHPIVLVDDLINSGQSFMRQVEILENMGHTVSALWVLVRYRDLSFYEYFTKKGIPIHAVFELNDFSDTLHIHNLLTTPPVIPKPPQILWRFGSPEPSYVHVCPKSTPVLDDTRLYVGSDRGTMWALNQKDGTVAWSHDVGRHPRGKGIFSSPAVWNNTVYFGAYDGNVYALDAATGKKKWISFEADWVGSSPALAPDLGLLFIGLEFGLWRKRGGIIALDLETGKKKWWFPLMPCYTHSSPLYIKEKKQVVIGSNDGSVYLFDATTGALIWKYSTGEPSVNELNTGFSAYDIKESCAYDPKCDFIVCGTMKGELHVIERATGTLRHIHRGEFGFVATPLIYKNTVIASNLDKHVYCYDLDTGKEQWRWFANARIFCAPTLIEGTIVVGTNAGELAYLDPQTGALRSAHLFPERIVNPPAYQPSTERLFVPTFANEIVCMQKTKL